MPNPIKYSTSAQTLALKKGNYWIGTGDVGKGPTSTTDYYNGITPPSGGYTIYLNEGSNGPSIYCPANDAALISLSNTIAGQTFATAAAALAWFATQTDKMVFNSDYPAIVTNGLILNLDAGFTPSYPTTGTAWYDISSGGNNGTLINGPTFSSANSGSIVFDGVDDYASTTISYSATASINLWIYPITGPGVFQYGDGSVGLPICLLDYTNTNLRVYVNNYYTTYSSVLTLNQWNNICLTLNPSIPQYTLYINNSLIGTGNIQNTLPAQTGIVILGDHNFTSNGNSRIASAQVYNRALSAAEILQNYNATKSRFGL